ncbi:polyprenol monophosphomannose synthase [Vulcanisaeta souniana]|uniref:Dolichol-phosphate mannosyltransferase n=1 Tax=Vulcanisaeta souniana JCM 11219 TaxID=1293586 RepID=A0ABN6SQ14_9CREN|nr:polyprenol monophosphomannose synthase [Vulcanisaeta souniana]BDR90912.1 dolichol-phosphate mannosyltransferase [Vulcanisaeta souniana JCM 11219]
MDTCVVLPTINEAENLKVLLPRLNDVLTGYDWFMVVVDDGSTDGTQDIVNDFAGSTGRVKLIERGTRLGLGSAIKTGIRACMDMGAKSIVVMDADLQHPPEVVPNLVKSVLGGVDLAIASRYVRGGGIIGWSLKRFIISKGATYLARLLMPWTRSIKDPISGFFAVNADKLKGIIDLLSDSSGYKLILEILTLMHSKYGDSLRVIEVPYTFRNRVYGTSKLGTNELANYAMLVLKLSNYSVLKYLVALLIGSFVGYLVFNFSVSLGTLLSNLLSIESSLITVITIYQLLMWGKPRPQYYASYHLVKYFAILIKLLLYAVALPAFVVLIISGITQLLITLRVIPINPGIVHVS